MSKKKITSFLAVFESKLEKNISNIKKELDKPKEERNKKALKSLLKEAKHMRKLVNELQDQEAKECICPNCSHKFKI